MTGILVHGDNHFIVGGPLPSSQIARDLARHWSLIRIGAETPASLRPWTIIKREFRENLQWAIVVPAETATSPAVATLLGELRARGVAIHT